MCLEWHTTFFYRKQHSMMWVLKGILDQLTESKWLGYYNKLLAYLNCWTFEGYIIYVNSTISCQSQLKATRTNADKHKLTPVQIRSLLKKTNSVSGGNCAKVNLAWGGKCEREPSIQRSGCLISHARAVWAGIIVALFHDDCFWCFGLAAQHKAHHTLMALLAVSSDTLALVFTRPHNISSLSFLSL